MWRPSIVAILLVVLIALISTMVGSGPIAPRALRWFTPLSWYSALTGGAGADEVGTGSVATSAPEITSSSNGDDIPAYRSAPEEAATVPVPAARPSGPRSLSRGSGGATRQAAQGSRQQAHQSQGQQSVGESAAGHNHQSPLAALGSDARRHTPSSQDLGPKAPPFVSQTEKGEQRDVFGSILGGFQRLLGRDFDSVQRPGELAAYCHANPATWIYDFGREAFVYCGNVVAGQFSAQSGDHAR